MLTFPGNLLKTLILFEIRDMSVFVFSSLVSYYVESVI